MKMHRCRQCGNTYFAPECSNGCTKGFGLIEVENEIDYTPITTLLSSAMADIDLYCSMDTEAANELEPACEKIARAWRMML